MVVHVPETGYLVAIKQNESQHKEELIELGYQFMVNINLAFSTILPFTKFNLRTKYFGSTSAKM